MLRYFIDQAGTEWRVWDVNPAIHVRRASVAPQRSLKVPEGWLCFEAAGERRRLSPIPFGWEDASDDELCAFCANATIVVPLPPGDASDAAELNQGA